MFTGYIKVPCTACEGEEGCMACGGNGLVISHMDDVNSGLVSRDEIEYMEVYTSCESCGSKYRKFVPNDPARDLLVSLCAECNGGVAI